MADNTELYQSLILDHNRAPRNYGEPAVVDRVADGRNPMCGDQLRVWIVIERNINLAQQFLERMPEGAGLDGIVRECRAHTRKGTPCQREPLPGRDYCPSHKHLEESFDGPEIPIEELEQLREVNAAA